MSIIKANNNTISAITSLPSAITTGAMVHLQTTTLSSDTTSIDFSNVFSATYKSYLFVFNQLISKSTSDYFISRFFSDTGTTAYTSTNYELAGGYASANSGANTDSNDRAWGLGYFRYGAGNAFHQNTPGSGHLYVHNPYDSGNRVTVEGKLGVHDGSSHVVADMFGMVAANDRFYGMRFLTTSSDLGDGTSISLYGLANS